MKKRLYSISISLLFLTACAHQPFPRLPGVLEPHSDNHTEQQQTADEEKNDEEELSTSYSKTPPAQRIKNNSLSRNNQKPPKFQGKDLVVSAENMSLPAFVNEVFGNLLGANFVLDKALQKSKDRVTLRVKEPQSAQQLYELARKVLGNYGIEIVQENNFLRLVVATKSTAKPPLLVSGSTLPDVPFSHRPIFQLVQLKVVRSGQILGWLSRAYAGSQLKIQDAQQRNAILLIGSEQLVREAVRAIAFFDKPFMRGRHSIRIEPAFISAKELAPLLVDVLTAQGYGAGKNALTSGSILVLPVEKSNVVLLFATDKDVLEHARLWAETLDKPNEQAGDNSLFFYAVQNTRADSIAATLNGLLAGGSGSLANSNNPQTARNNTTNRNQQSAGRLMVDEARNALIFKGEPAEWERMMSLIQKMDVPTKQVMVEVTIAEVSLAKGETFGVEWFANGKNGRFNSNFSSTPGEIKAAGWNWILDVAGQTSATLNAFAEDSRVNILSTPRLVVKTGASASLDVVTEIPTVVGRRASNQQTEGNTDILEDIVYRKTGIVLTVEPIIHAGDRVDLDITQEVSEALPLSAGGTSNSPAIFSRNVKTSLSLHSGGSVILAGLISSRETNSDGGVPVLKDIPFVGNLFKSSNTDRTRTELVIMIAPYIINNEDDAKSITDSLIEGLELIK